MLYIDEEKQDSSIKTPLVDVNTSKPLGSEQTNSFNEYLEQSDFFLKKPAGS